MKQIKKTGNKGAAKWELKITDKQSNTYSVYSSKKIHLIEYIKKHL